MSSAVLKFKKNLSLNNRPRLFLDLPYVENALLLQGPVGPFFDKLRNFLIQKGTHVFKIHFNFGDEVFYNSQINAFRYQGLDIEWKDYITKFIKQRNIKAIFLMGDKRFYHQIAISTAKDFGVQVYVLEEGYLRPNYFTLEEFGVNRDSNLVNINPHQLRSIQVQHQTKKFKAFIPMCLHAMKYWLYAYVFAYKFKNYKHHKNLDLYKLVCWVRGFCRFLLYELTEFGIRQKIRLDNNKKYFLCILQVHDDFQVTHNSKYDSVELFIEEVMLTFHQFTQDKITNDCLIIKHHPMDIGEKNYKKLIQHIMKRLNMCKDSVVYIHNFRHLPTIYNKIKGGIMINSTFGLKLLTNRIPVINLSTSFYHKAGLTFQGSLLEFFNTNNKVNKRLVHNYLNHLIVRSQVNGCLYSKEYEIE